MFNFIKEKISKTDLNTNRSFNTDEADAVLEYAHLIQELDDLSVNGTDSESMRPIEVEIPIEDDIEIESIEMSLTDGRVTDVPMDATLQESNYNVIKTFEDFYQEACNTMCQFPRESSDAFENRLLNQASKKFNEYKTYVIQEGLFGFDKLNMNDERLPAKVSLDFGPVSPDRPDHHYIVKLQVYYETDKRQKVLKKQLDSINIALSLGITENFAKVLTNAMMQQHPDKMKNVKSVWDVITPISFMVPIDPIDKHRIIFGFECEFLTETIYFSWVRDIKSKDSSISENQIGASKVVGNLKKISVDEVNKIHTKSKKDYIKENYENRRPNRFVNIFQEAIDFGDEGDSSTPPENIDDSSEPSVSMNDNPSDSTSADDNDNSDTVPVDSNNVSDQIAQKVSEDQQNEIDNNSDEITDVPIDDTGDNSTTDSNIDEKINDLDDMGNTDMELDEDTNNIDVDNMTIEELLEQGSDKLKGMTIQQLKEFLSGDSSQIQEAFFLNKKNINTELDIHLRKSLGILNDNEMTLDEIVKNFKKEGSKLNRVLNKASRMKKVYNVEEIQDIAKLNKCLIDLISIMGSAVQDKSYVMTVKRLIQAFTSQSVIVSKIIESKNKTVQESFDMLNEFIQEYKINSETGAIEYNMIEKFLKKIEFSFPLVTSIVAFLKAESIPLKIATVFLSIACGKYLVDEFKSPDEFYGMIDRKIFNKHMKKILKISLKNTVENVWPNVHNYKDYEKYKKDIDVVYNVLYTMITSDIKKFFIFKKETRSAADELLGLYINNDLLNPKGDPEKFKIVVKRIIEQSRVLLKTLSEEIREDEDDE